MNMSLGLFRAYFGVYSRLSPAGAALKAVQLMTSPRIKTERRQASSALFDEVVPLPGGALLSIHGNGQKKCCSCTAGPVGSGSLKI